jgi:hypothetical protein
MVRVVLAKLAVVQLVNFPVFYGTRVHKSPVKVKQSHYISWRHLGKRYSPYSFLTSALEAVCGQRHDPAPLYPQERTPVPIGYETGWAPEPI